MDHYTADLERESFGNPAPEHSDSKHTIRSTSNMINHKPQAYCQLKHLHPQVCKSSPADLTPTQRWLSDTAREAPWQAIEVAPEVLGAKTEDPLEANYNTGVSEAGAVYGGSLCSDQRTKE